jgi:glycosyltransferase involved in cell wall biosynthesis
MKNSRIVILSGVQGDTRRYRSHHLFEQLCLAGVECALSHITDPRLPELAAEVNGLVLHRVVWDRVTAGMVDDVRQRGGSVILDVDDLVFDENAFRWIDSPDFSDPVRVGLYRENMRRNRTTLDHSDCVLTSTSYLAERVRECGKPAWVHRNGFSLEMLNLSNQAADQPRPPGQRVIIGYASGTPTHDRDFALIRPALQRLLERCSWVELWLIGRLAAGDDWGPVGERVRRIPFVHWRELPALLAKLDINLAPLRLDNPFSQSKSEIKFMEAALVGVPTIASPTDAFSSAIRSGENGLLASGTQDWLDGLLWLAGEPFAREKIGTAAREDVLLRYAPWVRAEQAVTALQAAGLDMSARLAVKLSTGIDPLKRRDLWMPADAEKHPTTIERGLYSLRTRGLATLAKEVWVYLRRLVAPIFPFKPRRPV